MILALDLDNCEHENGTDDSDQHLNTPNNKEILSRGEYFQSTSRSLRSTLGAGKIDPFSTCPTNGQNAYYSLLNVCGCSISEALWREALICLSNQI